MGSELTTHFSSPGYTTQVVQPVRDTRWMLKASPNILLILVLYVVILPLVTSIDCFLQDVFSNKFFVQVIRGHHCLLLMQDLLQENCEE